MRNFDQSKEKEIDPGIQKTTVFQFRFENENFIEQKSYNTQTEFVISIHCNNCYRIPTNNSNEWEVTNKRTKTLIKLIKNANWNAMNATAVKIVRIFRFAFFSTFFRPDLEVRLVLFYYCYGGCYWFVIDLGANSEYEIRCQQLYLLLDVKH